MGLTGLKSRCQQSCIFLETLGDPFPASRGLVYFLAPGSLPFLKASNVEPNSPAAISLFSLFQLLPLTRTLVITLGPWDTPWEISLSQRQLISNLNSKLTQAPRAGHLNDKEWCFSQVNEFLFNLTESIGGRKWQHVSPSFCNLPLLFIRSRSLSPNRLDLKEQIESLIWLSTMQTHCSFPQAPLTSFLIQVTTWINIKGYMLEILI